MDMLSAHMGPLTLPEGPVFSQALSDRVFLETGVRAKYRSRGQWGRGKFLILEGPSDKLDTTWMRVILYGTAVGGGGGGGGGGGVGGGEG